MQHPTCSEQCTCIYDYVIVIEQCGLLFNLSSTKEKMLRALSSVRNWSCAIQSCLACDYYRTLDRSPRPISVQIACDPWPVSVARLINGTCLTHLCITFPVLWLLGWLVWKVSHLSWLHYMLADFESSFADALSNKFAVQWLLKDPTTAHKCGYTTLWNISGL